MKKYPDAAGVLVRRHGVYVWGKSLGNLQCYIPPNIVIYPLGADWEKAKTQAEASSSLDQYNFSTD